MIKFFTGEVASNEVAMQQVLAAIDATGETTVYINNERFDVQRFDQDQTMLYFTACDRKSEYDDRMIGYEFLHIRDLNGGFAVHTPKKFLNMFENNTFKIA